MSAPKSVNFGTNKHVFRNENTVLDIKFKFT